jgi:hypothetical protein|tara:strand:+ start:253 stop:1581 length:1329 start_codon:yes stop_codon:yes gene_type:complete
MAIIVQKQIFGWKDIEELGDLERLNLVLNYLPDEKLMRVLEEERGKGTDDYPVRATWNSVLAGVVFQHESVESLRRELQRNGQLREMCGFEVVGGLQAIPTAWAYSRFLKKLIGQAEGVDAIFDELVEELKVELPDFGRIQAFDGKGIDSYASGKKKEEGEEREADQRRDDDADWGKHVYQGVREDGSSWKKVKSWFGYTLHMIVDAVYELPIAFEVTKASRAEAPLMHELFEQEQERHPELIERCEYGIGDRGYDDGKLICKHWDEYGIKSVIDIRNLWKDGEETKQAAGQWNVVYDYKGTVFCICPKSGKQREMAFGGFEASRGTLKYRCPAQHYGYLCAGCEECPVGKALRISLSQDRRVFTPLARSSYSWQSVYKMRTAVERVNSRIDKVYGFEKHYIRGQKKMKLRVSLALCVMLAMALGRSKEKKKELMRSLVKAG